LSAIPSMISGRKWGSIEVLRLKAVTQFKRDLKKFKHDKNTQEKLEEILNLLLKGKKLPEKNKDHDLAGNYVYHRECHISPDVLLIYRYNGEIIYLERIGSHSELF
jgi:mRNA interferase YafQ